MDLSSFGYLGVSIQERLLSRPRYPIDSTVRNSVAVNECKSDLSFANPAQAKEGDAAVIAGSAVIDEQFVAEVLQEGISPYEEMIPFVRYHEVRRR